MSDLESGHSEWRVSNARTLSLDPFVLMGILNITPDSFSDGGNYLNTNIAVEHALEMVEAGAAIIDVGGESTRPGARRMPAKTQITRVVPAIRVLRANTDALISIDTTLADVAAAALDAGADIINDVSACTEDESIASLAAERGCGLILMHRLVPPERDSYSDQYESPPHYADVVAAVRAFLKERIDFVTSRGVEHQSIAVDPGLGFGKSARDNFRLMARCSEIGVIDNRTYPVVSGASRKSFIGRASGVDSPEGRVAGTLAANVAQYLAGVRIFRVHDVRAHRDALVVADALRSADAPRL